jgi:glycosyltransferase involved in cell wall biosynthesis
MKKVLFIHHGGIAGGAPLSLLYTALGVSKHGYIPEVALLFPSKELHALYNNHGFKTHEVSYIPFFIVWTGHSPETFSRRTLHDVVNAALGWRKSQQYLYQFLMENHYDLVHLNSAALSNVAQLLLRKNIPFVWHVREQGPDHKGWRFRFIHNLLAVSPNVIFLSHAERKSWGFDSHGTVIYNFIDFEQFNYCENSKKNVYREGFGLQQDDFVILFLGGLKSHKGTEVLIRAVASLIPKYPNIKLLMPDSANPVVKSTTKQPARAWTIRRIVRGVIFRVRRFFRERYFDFAGHIESLIQELGLSSCCIKLPFDPNSVPFFVSSDMVVFPAIEPHFARPIIEAAAMKKPVIASDFPVMRELVEDSETGYLFPPGNEIEFAKRIEMLITSPDLRCSMGEKALAKAKAQFDSSIQTAKVLKVYDAALGAQNQA